MDGVVIGREKGEGLIDACEINASLLTVLTVIVNPFLYRRTIRGSFVEARWKHGTRPVSFFFFLPRGQRRDNGGISRLGTTFARLDEPFLPRSKFWNSQLTRMLRLFVASLAWYRGISFSIITIIQIFQSSNNHSVLK